MACIAPPAPHEHRQPHAEDNRGQKFMDDALHSQRRSSLAGSSRQRRPRCDRLNRLLPVQCSEKLGHVWLFLLINRMYPEARQSAGADPLAQNAAGGVHETLLSTDNSAVPY
jgi:hypothetical protein